MEYRMQAVKVVSRVRSLMFSEFELEELVTEGSAFPEGESIKGYNSSIHEACRYAPLLIMYEKREDIERIKNLKDIKEVAEKSKAKGYILGSPITFTMPAEPEDVLLAIIPINFYKMRE